MTACVAAGDCPELPQCRGTDGVGDDFPVHFPFSFSDIFCKVEMPSQYCLALLELNGIGFSTVECESQKHIMQAKLDAIETQAYQLAGHSFSFTSADDIAQVVSCKHRHREELVGLNDMCHSLF